MTIKTYVIHLPHRTDRFESITKNLEAIGISDYKFLPGYPNSLIGLINPQQKWMKEGQIGFNIAYFNALSFIALNHKDNEQVLLLEDDAVLIDCAVEKLQQIAAKDYDIVYLFYKECREKGSIIHDNGDLRLIRLNYPVCTTAILYKVAAIKKLLGSLTTMETVCDNQIGLLIADFNVAGCDPYLAQPNDSKSDISEY